MTSQQLCKYTVEWFDNGFVKRVSTTSPSPARVFILFGGWIIFILPGQRKYWWLWIAARVLAHIVGVIAVQVLMATPAL